MDLSGNPNQDREVLPRVDDGVASLAWSPAGNFICAGVWSNKVNLWEIAMDGSSAPKDELLHEGPVLATCWSSDGSTIFSAGGDRSVKMWNLDSGQSSTVGMHDAPVKSLIFSPDLNLLVSGSWDKTVKFWDCRQQQPAAALPLPERCYAMDAAGALMVVACAAKRIMVYNLGDISKPFRELDSPMKYQTRCVSCFPTAEGWALGSVEGRVAIQHAAEEHDKQNFTFKCHREKNDIYAVNDISFHPSCGSFSTVGSDGSFHFWDKDNRAKLKSFKRCDQPISVGKFNRDGTIFAYAVSYDWSRGAAAYKPEKGNHILLHAVQENEVKQRPPERR